MASADLHLPASKIASLSSGEFVGFVADDPTQKIRLKGVHAEILNDHARIKKEDAAFKELPQIRSLPPDNVEQNYLTIKQEVNDIIIFQLAEMRNTPVLAKLIISKKEGQNRKRKSP